MNLKTKFNIKDVVWVVDEKLEPRQTRVDNINIGIYTTYEVHYEWSSECIFEVKTIIKYNTELGNFEEKYVFATKEELKEFIDKKFE